MREAARILDCLAAGYRLDLGDGEYVKLLLETAAPLLDRGLGTLGYTYDSSGPGDPVIDHFVPGGAFDPAWLPPFYEALAQTQLDGGPSQPMGYSVWGRLSAGQASQIPGMEPFMPLFAHIGGSRDSFAINALDASGRGLWLGAPLPTTEPFDAELVELLTRLAAHLTAAVRLRRGVKPSADSAAAVLSPGGQLLHAEDVPAVEAAREELREATLAFDEARSQAMRSNVELGTRRWRPLVSSRWTLLDEFDSDGRRFVIAAENAPPTRAGRRDLSEREHQVLTQAHLGHSHKEIAYELGLADSTVRVLLHRAAQKLGATTREEAIERFEALLTSEAKKSAE